MVGNKFGGNFSFWLLPGALSQNLTIMAPVLAGSLLSCPALHSTGLWILLNLLRDLRITQSLPPKVACVSSTRPDQTPEATSESFGHLKGLVGSIVTPNQVLVMVWC